MRASRRGGGRAGGAAAVAGPRVLGCGAGVGVGETPRGFGSGSCLSRRGSWKTSGEDGSPPLCSLPPAGRGSAPGWGSPVAVETRAAGTATRGQAPGPRAQVRCALCLFLPSVPAAAPPRPRTPPTFKNHLLRGFPGGPVGKTPRFPCRGRRFDP